MMYIDQAPLGGNLVNIIKKSASLSDGAATPAESSAPHSKELSCGDEANKQKTTINGEHGIPNGNHKDLAQTIKNFSQTIKIANSKLQFAEKEEEVEEDKTGYVLYDIEPDPEELTEKPVKEIQTASVVEERNLANGFSSCDETPDLSKKNSVANTGDISTTFKKRTREAYETEDNCEEFIVQIKPVPKLKPNRINSFTKPRRPLPAAIPIADVIAKKERLVLNKFLSRPSSRAYTCGEPEDTDYYLPQSSSADENLKALNSQMGMDIISNIWKNLFQRNSKSANINTEPQGTNVAGPNRKRSFGVGEIKTPQIKYRRVDNSFPKIITRAVDDDLENFPAFQPRSKHKSHLQTFAFPHNLEMTQRGENNPMSQRRSLFEYPQKKIVRNTTYADYEFSDDDDDDSQTRRLQHTLDSLASKSLRQTKVRNIPIQIEQPRSAMFPAPLSQPTYADILKQTPYGVVHVLGRQAGSSNNSSGDGASSSPFGNALGKSSRINSKAIGGSILRQEREKEDHEKYKQLLETLSARVNHQQNPFYPSSRPQSRQTLLNLPSTRLDSKKKSHLLRLPLPPKYRVPLSSTINIDDDNDNDDNENSSDEVLVTGITHLKTRPVKSSKRISSAAPVTSLVIDDDEDISEVIDLDDVDVQVKPKRKIANATEVIDLDAKENKFNDLPYVEPVNTFRDYLQTPSLKDDWYQNFSSKWETKGKVRKEEVGKTTEIIENSTSERQAFEFDLRTRFKDIYIVDPDLLGVDDFEKPEIEEVPEFPELDQERIKAAVIGPLSTVLIDKFNLRITRQDIHTLLGLNWLNDEIINFYMSMITDRSDRKHETHGYPKVYAMNTFFLQKVLQSGHSGVKRWTRRIDIFEKDIIPVPVHVGGVHWCMAIIHLKNRWIRYYDSMGSPNANVLRALEQYLKEESLDKRKQPFDTSDFIIESVADVPRQQNGSDCGVFSCMFAEYTARNKPITFEQKHMEYFRNKMILEIVQGELLL